MSRSSRLARLSPEPYALPPELAARLFSPSLVVFVDRVLSNLTRMLGYLGDVERWRPHLKTTKIPEVWRELLAAGVRNFKCATPREASVFLRLVEDLGVQGADLLVAYPLVPPNLCRVAALAAAHPETRVAVLSEDPAHAASVPDGLGVFVDINPGMNRTGIPTADPAAIHAVAVAAGSRLRGLHFYDGHVRDPDVETRRRRCWSLYDELLRIHAALDDRGVVVAELITSGTPAFLYALSHPGLRELSSAVGGPQHRVSPGTVLFHDAFSDDLLEDLELEPAALLFTRVISRPSAGVVTCDAGSKSLAAEAGDPAAFVLGHPELVPQKPSEEHLPLRLEGPDTALPALGTPLYLVPRHVCPTVNLAESALLVARDRPPQVVSVAARAHDLLDGLDGALLDGDPQDGVLDSASGS